MLLSGLLTNAFGWEVIFYVLGTLIVVWFVCWSFLGFKDPESHPRISEASEGTFHQFCSDVRTRVMLNSKFIG